MVDVSLHFGVDDDVVAWVLRRPAARLDLLLSEAQAITEILLTIRNRRDSLHT